MENDIKTLQKTNNIDSKVMGILLEIGISANLQGYQYLRESIKLVIENPLYISSITKKMYPQVAETFNTTACRVERGIRHAIDVSFNKGKMININKIFGLNVLGNNERPTNSEFVALVADRLALEFC